jgi:hypothetical protein
LDEEGGHVRENEEEGHFGWFDRFEMTVCAQVGDDTTEEDVIGW